MIWKTLRKISLDSSRVYLVRPHCDWQFFVLGADGGGGEREGVGVHSVFT